MSFQKMSNIQHLKIEKIKKNIIEIKKEIFELKIKKSTRQPIQSHLFKYKKHQLAQLLTLKTQKEKNN
uniref:ribosomal protein L29 n=1 Tax=Catenella fusiformis TaxID=3024791 RepID=UPI0027DA9A89|nr:ribosomal protein L29 [Catenella fusiformis]WCH57568.1 ribosomal protein L29 [Catenella fusiformis]